MDIRTKLVLALVSASLLSMALFGFLTYLLSAELFRESSARELTVVAAARAQQLDAVLTGWQTEAVWLARQPEVAVAAARPADDESLGRLLANAPSAEDVRWLSVYDGSGRRLSTTRPDLPPAPSTSGRTSPHVAGARLLPDGRVAVVVAAPVAGGAVLNVAFDAGALDRVTGDISNLAVSGRTLLLAPAWLGADGAPAEGFLVVSGAAAGGHGPGAEAPAVVAVALARPAGAAAGTVLEADEEGVPVLAAVQALAVTPWATVVIVDRAHAFARTGELFALLRDIGFSLGAPVIVGGVALGLYLGNRIKRLADTVDRIRQGELELRAEVDGEDEVTLLAKSLNEFMDQLHRSSDIFQLGPIRVLVAEGVARTRALLLELLTNWRMRVTLAADAAAALEAVEAAERDGEPIQLVVLDEALPDLGGAEVAERLAARDGTRCPVILLSDHPERLDRDALQRAGVGKTLQKPVIASDLMEATLEQMGVSAPAMAAVPDVLLAPGEPRRVLLVEDSSLIQRVTVGFLERWGHRVTVVNDGRGAVAAAGGGRFDVIFMDLEMPEMDGLEATRAIRAAEADEGTRVPIIALTARATRADREACMAAGMDDYVCKPVDPKVLYRLVAAHPARAAAEAAPAEEAGMMTDKTENPDSPIDWEAARALTGGDMALLGELIELFPEESGKHLAEVRAGVDADDAERVTRGAHSLKSAAKFFGAERLVACALEIENLGRAEKIAEAAERLSALAAETARLTTALEREQPPG